MTATSMVDRPTRIDLESVLPCAASSHTSSIEIRAAPYVVWSSLHQITTLDCWATTALVVMRSIPSFVVRRGALHGDRQTSLRTPLLDELASGRFPILHRDPPRCVVFGIIGQFWKLDGGTDVEFDGAGDFLAFDRPGYVKTAMSFDVAPTARGSRLTTETRNAPTDEHAARRFAAYWSLIGRASRLTRVEMLHAVRRRADRSRIKRPSPASGG